MFVLFAVVPLSISAAPKNRSAMQVPGYRAVRVHYGPMNKMIMSVRINGQPANLLVDTGSNQMILNRIFRIEEMDFRDRRLKARRVAPSKAGAERVSIH
jgi:predicted aspartyl protease